MESGKKRLTLNWKKIECEVVNKGKKRKCDLRIRDIRFKQLLTNLENVGIRDTEFKRHFVIAKMPFKRRTKYEETGKCR